MAEIRNIFIHHVFFWLKRPGNGKDYEQLVAGLRKLSQVKTIREFHIGKPANTNRNVIERSYSLSWFVVFGNAEDQDSYQTDPVHLKFVEECAHLWEKVLVHGTVDT
ncbi:MAG: Dabb family protein [Chitinophagales bacterium]